MEAVPSQFNSPEQELAYLREQVASKEFELRKNKEEAYRPNVVNETIQEYKKQIPEEVLSKDLRLSHMHKEAIVLDLKPEPHDKQIEELIGLLQEKGVLNTIAVIERMNNPHLEDDFHRFLVQYIKQGLPTPGLKEGSTEAKALAYTLYEVSLPDIKKEDEEKELKLLVSSMEQFYSGMLSVETDSNKRSYMSIELAVSAHDEETVFYTAVPDDKKNLFEKQVLSIFPHAKLIEKKDDYNIFNEDGVSVGSYLTQSRNAIYPIKTYDQFDYDPLNVVLNTFSKLDREHEGASIQLIFSPAGDYYVSRYKHALKEITSGVKLNKAIDIRHTVFGEFMKTGKEIMSETVKDMFKTSGKKGEPEKEKQQPIDESAVENIKKKVESPIVDANIRIVVSAPNQVRANQVLSDLESAFNQFDNPLGNAIKFERQTKGNLTKLFKDYSYRLFSDEHKLPLSIKEVTTMIHFPGEAIKASPQLKRSKAGTSAAPLNLSREGILLGLNKDRNIETKIFMGKEDRLRHFYTIGQTGTGKTNFLKNMIIQDIKMVKVFV